MPEPIRLCFEIAPDYAGFRENGEIMAKVSTQTIHIAEPIQRLERENARLTVATQNTWWVHFETRNSRPADDRTSDWNISRRNLDGQDPGAQIITDFRKEGFWLGRHRH
jgi:hypothetical protein